jgi:hypothetical protein
MITLLAFFGGTASVGQLILWILGVSGGVALTYSLVILIPIGTIFALVVSRPSTDTSFRHTGVGSSLRICVGDLFDTTADTIVVTMNRNFDTSRELVSSQSLVAQLLRTSFENETAINTAIKSQTKGLPDEPQETGHIVQVSWPDATYLLLAVVNRNEETSSSVTVDEVWTALSHLWQFARKHNIPRMRVPIIGAGYARAHVGRAPLLILLITSYLTSAMELSTCDLDIVIHPVDADPDLLELSKHYCEMFGYKITDSKA